MFELASGVLREEHATREADPPRTFLLRVVLDSSLHGCHLRVSIILYMLIWGFQGWIILLRAYSCLTAVVSFCGRFLRHAELQDFNVGAFMLDPWADGLNFEEGLEHPA